MELKVKAIPIILIYNTKHDGAVIYVVCELIFPLINKSVSTYFTVYYPRDLIYRRI